MRIIHTADWHLGKVSENFDRRSEHSVFLEWLLKVLEGNATACGTQADMPKADVLLIAGDVFDTPNPSADSQKMYYKFLLAAKQRIPKLQTVIIAGNHDSAARLEAPADLLDDAYDVHVVGRLMNDNGSIDYGKTVIKLDSLNIIAVPYIRGTDFPNSTDYATGVCNIYQKCLDYAYSSANFNESLPLIGMGHMFMAGSMIHNIEKTDSLGGIDQVDAKNFANKFDYFALGHLHMEQSVAGMDNIRYAGSPISMSFSEYEYRQSVTELTFAEGSKAIERALRIFDAPAKLYQVPAKPKQFDEVVNALERLSRYEGKDDFKPFLRVNVLSDYFSDAQRSRIAELALEKNMRLTKLKVIPETKHKEGEDKLDYNRITDENTDPLDIVKDVYFKLNGKDMSDNYLSMMKQAIKEAKEEDSDEN